MKCKKIISAVLSLGLIYSLNSNEDKIEAEESNIVDSAVTVENNNHLSVLDFLDSIPVLDFNDFNEFSYTNVDAFFNHNNMGYKKVNSFEEFDNLQFDEKTIYSDLYKFDQNVQFVNAEEIEKVSGIANYEISRFLRLGKAPDIQVYFDGNFSFEKLREALNEKDYTYEQESKIHIFRSPSGGNATSLSNGQNFDYNFLFGGLTGQANSVMLSDNYLSYASLEKKTDALIKVLKEDMKFASILSRGIIKESLVDLNNKAYSKDDNIFRIDSTYLDRNIFELNPHPQYEDEFSGNVPIFKELITIDSIADDAIYLNMYLAYENESDTKKVKEIVERRILNTDLETIVFNDLKNLGLEYDSEITHIDLLEQNQKVLNIEIKCGFKNEDIDLSSIPGGIIRKSLISADLTWLR